MASHAPRSQLKIIWSKECAAEMNLSRPMVIEKVIANVNNKIFFHIGTF